MNTPLIIDYSSIPHTERRWCDWFTDAADLFRWPIFGLLLIWYLVAFNGQWRMEPDSALYLSIGKNIAEGHGYTFRGVPDRLAYPGLPYVHAALFKCFGTQTLVPAHVLMLLTTLATLALTYRLFLLHGSRGDAVMGVVGVAITYTFFRYGYELRNDMPFLLGVTMFLVGYESKLARFLDRLPRESDPAPAAKPWKIDWCFLVAGFAVAVLMRPAMWALVLAVAITAAVALFRPPIKPRKILITLLALLVFVGGVFAYVKLDPRRAGQGHRGDQYEDAIVWSFERDPIAFAKQVLHNAVDFVESQSPQALFAFEFGRGFNTLFVGTMLFCGLMLVRRRVLWGAWVAATLLMIFLVQSSDRYLLAILPLLIFGWWHALKWISRRSWRRTANLTFLILLGLGALPNSTRVFGLIVEQRQPHFLQHYKDGRFDGFPQIAERIHGELEPNAKVIVPAKMSRIFTFLSGRSCYEPRDAGSYDLRDSPLYLIQFLTADMFSVEELSANGVKMSGNALFWVSKKTNAMLLFPLAPTAKSP